MYSGESNAMKSIARNIALCYVRRSFIDKDDSGTLDSIKRQQSNVLAEATRRGWIPEEYADAEGHRSGRYEHTRPGWLDLKAQLDRPDVRAVIVESLSRASRSVKDLFNFLELLNAREIALISLKEQIDTTNAMGRAFVGFIAVMNQFESDIASERMAGSIVFKKTKKGRHWGRTPFGCDRAGDDHILIPSKDGATVEGIWRGYHDALHKCYEWYANDSIGFQLLADRLNASGYRFRDRHGSARLFNHSDVRRILDAHRIYAGFVFKGAAKTRPTEIYKGSHAPILPVELCDQVAEVLASRQRYARHLMTRDRTWQTYLLTPFLHCAECGRQMAGMYQDGQRWYRHERAKKNCRSKGQIAAVELEQQVIECLAVFNMPDILKERIKALARQMAKQQARPEWQDAERKVKALNQKLARLKEMRIEGELDKPEYDRRKGQIESEIRKSSEGLRAAPRDVRDIEDLLSKVEHIADVIRAGSAENKKKLYATLFERIEQRDGRLTQIIPRAWAKPFFGNAEQFK
jgi:site-specific DNA recombinase